MRHNWLVLYCSGIVPAIILGRMGMTKVREGFHALFVQIPDVLWDMIEREAAAYQRWRFKGCANDPFQSLSTQTRDAATRASGTATEEEVRPPPSTARARVNLARAFASSGLIQVTACAGRSWRGPGDIAFADDTPANDRLP